ncbi:hypothetical protein TNCV_2807891 [Trichonephila clavipes]|nr:hypothetical protein TNCV_2807891 [Trichonephila clavipes]
MFSLVVVTNVTCLTISDRGPRSSSWQRARCTPVVSRSFEYHAGDSTFWLGFTPILRENTLGVGRRLPPLFPFHQPKRGDLRLDRYSEYPHAAKALYIYKHLCFRTQALWLSSQRH